MKERDFSTRARRSTRVVIRIPVRIGAVDRSGSAELTDGSTSIVNLHGTRITCKRLFQMGQAVEITVPSTGKAGKGKVIWLDPAPDGVGAYELAVEFDKPANLWAIDFPPGDWGREIAPMGPETEEESTNLMPVENIDPPEALPQTGPSAPLDVAIFSADQALPSNMEVTPLGEGSASLATPVLLEETVSEPPQDLTSASSSFATGASSELPAGHPPIESLPRKLEPDIAAAPAQAIAAASQSHDPSLALPQSPMAALVSPPPVPASLPSRTEATPASSPSTANRLADAVKDIIASVVQSEQSAASEQLVKGLEDRMAQMQQEVLQRLTDKAATLVSAQSSSMKQRADEIADRSEEVLAQGLRQVTEASEQKAKSLEGAAAATVAAALDGLRGQVAAQLTPVEGQFLEQCRSLAERSLSEMLETTLRAMSLRIEEMNRNIEAMQQRAQQILLEMSAQLEQCSSKAIEETTGRLHSRLEDSAQQIDSNFQQQVAKELSEKQQDLAGQFQQQIGAVSEKSVQEMRGALSRMLHGLADRAHSDTASSGTVV